MSLFTISEETAAFREAISRAVAWLDSEQPEDAIMSHHGIRHKGLIGPIHLTLSQGRGGWPVLVADHKDKYSEDWAGYTASDIAKIRCVVEGVVPVRSTWNGKGYATFSLSLGHPFGPGLAGALARYRAAGPAIFDDQFWKDHPVKVTKPEGWA